MGPANVDTRVDSTAPARKAGDRRYETPFGRAAETVIRTRVDRAKPREATPESFLPRASPLAGRDPDGAQMTAIDSKTARILAIPSDPTLRPARRLSRGERSPAR